MQTLSPTDVPAGFDIKLTQPHPLGLPLMYSSILHGFFCQPMRPGAINIQASTCTMKTTLRPSPNQARIRSAKGFTLLIAVCALLSLAACGGTEVPKPLTPAQSVPSGAYPPSPMAFRQLVQQSPLGPISHWIGSAKDPELLVLELSPRAWSAELVAYPGKGITARKAQQLHGLDIVIGSGFVSTVDPLQPVGLLRRQGQTLSGIESHGYTRIFGIHNRGLGVAHRKTYQEANFHSALQVGPGIVENSQLDISERDLLRPTYFRSFVGLCAQRWLLGISLKPTHLRTLGQQFLAYAGAKQWQCHEVVNFAGDRQAILLASINSQRVFYHGDPDSPKVSLLGFRKSRGPDGDRD